ncbi:DUF1707 domain-containing protein [Micromonospora sp. WMMD1102]|uniref:DUF1707 SHOCT-like domain-containing protein n=1 Tax=Micromonospora sp. WMMD1102 TaxID=3016105 RepID=UPI0024151811|nr:DUF1707 domain-containing protein [Micromonospora sp. WMMD1102]MDG4789944.1 DUF1707 domain-containing protein [Micromonospora sp. WMMD1102]
MDRRDQMRAADSDRTAVADQLRQALNEGRLDLGEYDDRLQRAYAAKTYADLDGLLTDLPGTVPVDQARLVPTDPKSPVFRPGPDGRYPGATRAWLADTWDGYFGLVGVVVAIWAVTSVVARDFLYFWPGWVAGPLGALLLVGTVTGLAKGEPQRWAAKQAAKQAARERAKIEKQARIEERKRRRDEQAGQGEPP